MFRNTAKRLRFMLALVLALSLFIIPVSAKFTTITVFIRGQELISDPMVRRTWQDDLRALAHAYEGGESDAVQ